MKILSPKEFKLENPESYLEGYLEYLEGAIKSAEEALENARNLKLDDSYIETIHKQVGEILEKLMLIDEYMGHIVLKSVDSLKLEELQTYFDFEEEKEKNNVKRKEFEQEKMVLNNRLKKIEERIQNNLYLNGRVKKFYRVKDVEEFFMENKDVSEFLINYLEEMNNNDDSIEDSMKDFKEKLAIVLKTECRIQDIKLSSDDIINLSDEISDLFIKCKNILIYSPEALEDISKVILSDTGIMSILPENFDDNTATYLMIDLMNLTKLNTEFYENLPQTLQVKLDYERLSGETYSTLLRTYKAFVAGEDLPEDDLNDLERCDKENVERDLLNVNYKIVSLVEDAKARENFLVDVEAMRSVLKENILKHLDGQVSASMITSLIKESEVKTEALRNELEDASNLLAIKTEDLKKAQSILVDEDYNEFFENVERNNSLRIYQFNGVKVTEEVILPFLEEEKRRRRQLEIMINLENELCDIYDLIKEKMEKFNGIIRGLPFYKASLKKLDDKYQETINEALQELKENDLIYIELPRISDESTVGNVIVLPSEVDKHELTNFSELNGIKQTFWDMPVGIDRNTKQYFLNLNPEFDNWDDYYKNLTSLQESLINKLFSFSKNEDGYYIFDSSKGEREYLKKVQNIIVEIISSIYEERKALRLSLGEVPTELESSKVCELEYFLGKDVNLSRENLAVYIENTKSKIEDLKELLARNKDNCSKFGIELTDDILKMNVSVQESHDELDGKIRELNIDGVNNLADVIEYRDLLLDLEGYLVPAEEVKKYYLENVKK